jgi:hypothetical protein
MFMVVYALLVFACIVAEERFSVFDDAFITYRYAKNLAHGYGITWNPGAPPVEGYTNFMLVILLAPGIRLGFDPLWTVRILSFAAALATSVLIALSVRAEFKSSLPGAMWVGSLFLLFPMTARVSMLGLETVLYAFFLFLSFYSILQFTISQKTRYAVIFGLAATCSVWCRPEGIILIFICVAAVLVQAVRRKIDDAGQFRFIFLVSFVFPICLQLLWKYIHFGSIIPNPFYIKVAGQHILSPTGLNSVLLFIMSVSSLWLLIILSLAERKEHVTGIIITLASLISYFLFFSHVHTLMDMHSRFLFPLLPFALFASSPILLRWFTNLDESHMPLFFKYCIIVIASFIISGLNFHTFFAPLRAHHGIAARFNPNDLMYKEYVFAKKLSQYSGIRETTIACSDAGAIPYFTEARNLDIVGLNDRFFATHRNLNELIDYFFQEQPDIAFIPTVWNKNNEMQIFLHEHGPLGGSATLLWLSDPRWIGYAYAGTINSDYYDLNIFVRRNYPRYGELSSFIRRIADRCYERFPLDVGNRDVYKLKAVAD